MFASRAECCWRRSLLPVLVACSAFALHLAHVARAAEPAPLVSSETDDGVASGGEIADGDDLDQLLNLADQDVSQLARVHVAAPALQMEVSTVSRQQSTVGRSPAAVFVITNEMIRRSGARSIPEVLRMAPGVNVARIDANKWAVSIRGFNGRLRQSPQPPA